MLRVGCVILLVWGCVHFLCSALSLAYAILRKHAPLMEAFLSQEELENTDARIHSIAKFADIWLTSCAACSGAFAVVIVWFALREGQHWAFWALLSVGLFYQTMSLVADSYVSNRIIIFNISSFVVFVIGIAVSGYGLFGG